MEQSELKLSSFSSEITDIARPNRFVLTITPPSIASVNWPTGAKYYVKSAQIPGRNVGDRPPLSWFGMQDKRPGDPTYEDLTVSFHLDSDFKVRKEIEYWVDHIAGTGSNQRLGNYKGTAKVEQISGMFAPIATFYLFGVYPKNYTPIELNYESSDVNSEFSVTFNVDYWTNSDNAQAGIGVGEYPAGGGMGG